MCLLVSLFLFLFSLFSLILLLFRLFFLFHFLRLLLLFLRLLFLNSLLVFTHSHLLNGLRLLFTTHPTTRTVQIKINNSVIIMPSKKPMPTSMPQMIRG